MITPEDRKRIKIHVECLKCRDLGIVRVQIGDVGTLARCGCDIGDSCTWELPSIKDLKVDKTAVCPMEQFKPPFEPKTQIQVTRFIREKISWWTMKIELAKEFWKNFNSSNEATKQVQSQADERVPE